MALSKRGKKILGWVLGTILVLGVIAIIVCAVLGLFSPSSSPSGGGGGSSPQSGGGGGSSPQSGGGGGSSPQSGGGGGSSPQSGGGGGSSPQSGGDGSPGDWYNIYNTDGDGTNSYGYATLLENYKNDGTLAAIDGTTLDTSGVDPDVRANFVDLLQNKTRTGLWLDTYDSIDRLEAALEKGGFTKIIFLFYDLPNRDCAASSSNGQLCCTNFLNGASFCDAETMQSFAGDDAQPSRTYCLGLNDDMTQANPDASRARDYKNKYGITISDYDLMFLEQDGVCKICSKAEPTYTNLAVDHCHTTGKVRGLLCTPCNKALGLFEDKQDLLLNAISYLKSSSN